MVSLGALSPAEVNRVAAETLGAPPTSEIVRSLMVATAGLPFLLRPAIAAAGSPDGEAPATAIMQAAKFALIERLRRLDEPVLDTLLVSSLSPELGPDDVAAALRVGAEEAQALVDRARASGLIEPSHSHTFLRSVHRCIAGIIGTARHHDTEISLLVSQTRIVNAVSGSRVADGRTRAARRPAGHRARRSGVPHPWPTRAGGAAVPGRRRCGGDGPVRAPGRRARADRRLHHGRSAGRRTARLRRRGRARGRGPDRRQHRPARRQRGAGGRPVPVARAVSRRVRQRVGRDRGGRRG